MRPTGLDGPVNKRDLSTGETGEFAGENAGFGPNPGVASVAPRDLSSNRRESTARKNLRNVADTGAAAVARCCQENHGSELGWRQFGSPAWIRTTITSTNAESVTYSLLNGLKCRNGPEKPALVHNSYTELWESPTTSAIHSRTNLAASPIGTPTPLRQLR